MKVCREIKTLKEFEDRFGPTAVPSIEEDGCYGLKIEFTDDLPGEVHPGEFLELVVEEEEEIYVVMFSVTSEEHNYLEWLEVAYDIPGASVTEVDRGSYTCYLCVVPTHPKV